jgi:N-acetylmuramoyl-L-alanine amidase
MSKLIALDDGHGLKTAGKRTPVFTDGTKSELGLNYMNENLFNRAVVKYLDAELKRCGFRTVLVAPTDDDTPLATRVATANNAGADLYLSVHANAIKGVWGTWGGTETFVWKNTDGSTSNSVRIGNAIHKHLMKGTPLTDRGVKDGNWLYVVKNTKMPSVLVECAFMDNLREAKLLLSDAFRRECATEIAMGICEGYGVKYVPEKVAKPEPTGQWYRVRLNWSDADSQKGAFQDLDNAKELADSLKNKGDYRVFNEKGQMVYDPTPEKVDEVWYRVRKTWADAETQVGAFHELGGAKEKADEMAKEGYKVFDEKGKVVYEPKVVVENEFYRVRVAWDKPQSQIGAFKELDGAKQKADENAHDGYKVFDDNGKAVYTPKVETKPAPTPKPKPEPKPEPPKEDHSNHSPVIGQSTVSIEKMVAFAKTVNPEAQDLEEIAKSFIEVGNKYGVRGDVAFCQSLIETGWFKFDGGTAVTPDQHNYCGMGVTSKGMKGNSFDTVRDGVTAQIQHLYAYATKLPIPSDDKLLDPRFKYVTRGIAPHWEDLSNRWAMNENYGKHILSLYVRLVTFEYTPPVIEEPTPEPPVQEPPVQDSPINEEEEKMNFFKKLIDYFFEKLASFMKGGKQ